MPTGSTTTSTMASTNPALTSLFTGLFGGTTGAGATATGTLSSIAKGSNISDLNRALTQSNQQTFGNTVSEIKEAFGSGGMSSSSALAKVLGHAATQNSTNLTSQLATTDLQAQGQQQSAAQFLTQIFSGSANNYFNNQSTKNDSGLSSFINLFSALFPGGV